MVVQLLESLLKTKDRPMVITLYAFCECNPKPASATRRKVTIFDMRNQFIRFYIGSYDWDSVLYVGIVLGLSLIHI